MSENVITGVCVASDLEENDVLVLETGAETVQAVLWPNEGAVSPVPAGKVRVVSEHATALDADGFPWVEFREVAPGHVFQIKV